MERGGQLDQVLQQRPGEVLKLAGIEPHITYIENRRFAEHFGSACVF